MSLCQILETVSTIFVSLFLAPKGGEKDLKFREVEGGAWCQ